MILKLLQRGYGSFEFNEKLPNHAKSFTNTDIVTKKFAWFPTAVYFSEHTPHRVLIWLCSYHSVARTFLARTNSPELSSFEVKRITCLNRFTPHPQKRVLSLYTAIEAISYYHKNRSKVSKLIKDTSSLEVEVPGARSSFSDWSASNWKYLAIQSNNLLDQLYKKGHVDLVPFVDEINY